MAGKSLIVLLVAIVFFFIAKKSHPVANTSGTAIAGQASSPKSDPNNENSSLRVATFNIQTGKNKDGVRNIQGAAGLINDQHLVGIQEIYAPGWLNKLGLGQSQLEALLGNKPFGHLMAATRKRWFREQRGNALLSRLPVLQWRIEALPDYTGKSFRNMTVAQFEWQGTPVTFINTHLHTGQGREEQLDIVLAEFAKYPVAILVGDFNSRRDTKALAKALDDPLITDTILRAKIDTEDPEQRIDWILTKGFNVASGKVVGKGISDHPYYEVSLDLFN